MKLIIEDDEGRKTVVPVVRDEITIGRQDGNTIKLTERNVSRRHARIFKGESALLIEDLGSYTGVRINGDKIEGPTEVKEGDLIEIGDYDLGIQGKFEASAKPAPAPAPKPAPAPPAPKPAPAPVAAPKPARVSSPGLAAMPSAPPPAAAPPAPAPAPSPDHSQESAPLSPGAGGATAIININKLMAQGTPEIEARDLQKSEMPRIVGLVGPFRGKEFYLMRTEWKVGRTEENDLAIDHQSISRQHCKFLFDGADWKIYDNKSANGVKVNGEEYAVAPVKPGDTVEFGHVKFRFCAPGEKFSPPPEKTEGAAAPSGGKPPPTTAELIAGAQGKGPSAQPRAAATQGKSKTPMIIGAVVVVALVIGAVAMMGKKSGDAEGSGSGPTGESAFKAAQAAAAKKDFKKASELANAAGTADSASFKKKMADEAAAQEASERFDAALATDPDKAKIEFDRCGAENTYWCGKVKEKEDAFKQSFAKKHLAAAAAAKGTNPALCSEEVGKVLQIDSNNAEAQTLSSQCAPAQAVAAAAPPPPPKAAAPAGPSQKDRDAMAQHALEAGTAKVNAGNLSGAMQDLGECVEKKPSSAILGKCYRALGVANAKAGNVPDAAKWLKRYLPLCDPAECDRVKLLIAKYGG